MENSVAPSHELPKFKNNGPWIAGIIGVLAIIPHYIILAIWSLLGNHLETHVEGPSVWALIVWHFAAVLMVVGLVLSLFGKSNRYAKFTGLLNLEVGVGLIVVALLGARAYIAMFSGIPFVVAGLLAIRNSGLPDDNVTLA